jgi:hypothetical protein
MKRLTRSNLLRRWWKAGLALALGLTASRASAEDIQWRAATDAKPAAPAVTMLAPVPLPAAVPAAPDPFRKVSYTGVGDADSRVIFRAQMGDPPKMLPVGTPEGPEDPPKKKADSLPAPRVVSSPAPTGIEYRPGPGPCAPAPMCCDADGCGRFGIDDCCGRPSHCFWGSAEYLVWWLKGQTPPPLVTAGNPADAVPGALGQAGTVVLFGGHNQGDESSSGARLRLGWWFDENHTVGIDGSAFFLGQQTRNFTASSFGSPALFRPFFNTGSVFVPGTGFVNSAPFEDAEAVAFPGALAGAVNVRQTSRLWGYDANLRTSLFDGCCKGVGWNIDGYAGFRSISLDESLQISESLGSFLAGAEGNIAVVDKFKTDNTFYGGQIGLEGEMRWHRWFLNANTRLAMGDIHQVVQISGATATSDATGTHTSLGGLLAQGTNIGNYSRDRFALVPELGLNVGYQLTDCLRLFVGYNLLYVTTVVRPADQIDRIVNPTQIPRLGGGTLTGSANPAFNFRGTDFYAQGFNLGVEFRW